MKTFCNGTVTFVLGANVSSNLNLLVDSALDVRTVIISLFRGCLSTFKTKNSVQRRKIKRASLTVEQKEKRKKQREVPINTDYHSYTVGQLCAR